MHAEMLVDGQSSVEWKSTLDNLNTLGADNKVAQFSSLAGAEAENKEKFDCSQHFPEEHCA